MKALSFFVPVILLTLNLNAGVINASRTFQKINIKVVFQNGELERQGLVAAIANEWTEYANIVFQFYFPDDYSISEFRQIENSADILVQFNTTSNHWTKGSNFDGQSKYIVAISDLTPRTVLHEFGHALGLQHEHQHPKSEVELKENFKGDFCEAIGQTESECDHNVLKRYSGSEYKYTPYNPDSIMHYPFSSYFTKRDKEYGAAAYLSYGDVEVISRMYPGKLHGMTGREIKNKIKKRAFSNDYTYFIKNTEDDNGLLSTLMRSKDGKEERIYGFWHFLGQEDKPLFVTYRYFGIHDHYYNQYILNPQVGRLVNSIMAIKYGEEEGIFSQKQYGLAIESWDTNRYISNSKKYRSQGVQAGRGYITRWNPGKNGKLNTLQGLVYTKRDNKQHGTTYKDFTDISSSFLEVYDGFWSIQLRKKDGSNSEYFHFNQKTKVCKRGTFGGKLRKKKRKYCDKKLREFYKKYDSDPMIKLPTMSSLGVRKK